MPMPIPMPAIPVAELLVTGLPATVVLVAAVVGLAVWLSRRSSRRDDALLRELVHHSGDVIAVLGVDGRLHRITGSPQTVLGRPHSDLHGRALEELVHRDDRSAIAELLSDAGDVSRELGFRVRAARDGAPWLQVAVGVTDLRANPTVDGLVLRMRDASAEHEREQALRHRALTDPLTALPNRALFADRVEQALHRSERDEGLVAVAFVDLDDFKGINDTLGHQAGDELLASVAERLRASLRSMDTAARLGGDEFGVLLAGISERSELVQIAERMLASLSRPHDLGGVQRVSTPSIGIAVRGEADTAADLLRNADAAMYAAKRAGKGRFELFTGAADPDARGAQDGAPAPGWALRSEEERAEVLTLLAQPEPVVSALQPILDLRTGVVAGHEALARFEGPAERPPNAWFALARRCGLGPRLEATALANALALRGRPDGTFLALNVSPAALVSEEVLAVLPGDLAGIVLEISERELLEARREFDEVLVRLRHRGARLAVDDTGAGFAGLRELMRVRPDVIKLDRIVVEGLADDEGKRAIVEAVSHVARRIRADVCAEGVEAVADLEVLRGLDIRYAQGWAVGRPGVEWGAPAPEAMAATPRRSGTAVRPRRATSTAPPLPRRR
jgi:diguanylate cyclase (GGDEF)-like protein/PAS domain S-box-containing protein